MTHNICFILLAVDKENSNDPLKIWGLYLFVLAFPGECVNQLGSEVKSIPERSAGRFKTLDVWHRLMLCDIFFIDMKFGINQAISQTITQLSCIQLETPSSRLWNLWWIKTYTTFKNNQHVNLSMTNLSSKIHSLVTFTDIFGPRSGSIGWQLCQLLCIYIQFIISNMCEHTLGIATHNINSSASTYIALL